MYKRVEGALNAVGLAQYWPKFREHEMDDDMVELCLSDPEKSDELLHIIPILAHLIKFKSSFKSQASIEGKSLSVATHWAFDPSRPPTGSRKKGSLKRQSMHRKIEKRAPSLSSELVEIFNAVDVDGSGRITVEELFKATKNDSRMSLDTCRLMIGLFDDDDKGSINLTGFIEMTMKVDEWQSIFEKYDRNASGYLDRDELVGPLQEMVKGYQFDSKFVDLIVNKFGDMEGMDSNAFVSACAFIATFTQGFRMQDKDNKGSINYQDFLSVVLNSWN